MTELPDPAPVTDDEDEDVQLPIQLELETKYGVLQGLAEGVNHQIRVVVIAGSRLEPGQELTVKPFEVDPVGLTDALDRIGKYIASPEAKRRGELYKAREDADKKAGEAWAAWMNARAEARDAARAIEDDTQAAIDDEEDDENVTTTAGELRDRLNALDPDPAVTEALERIKDLPDDTVVDVVDDERED